MSFPEQFEKAINSMDLSKQHTAPESSSKLKTFEVYHMESNDGFNDRYYNGIIEAENIDKAIEIFKNEWIKEEYQNDICIETIDENGLGNKTALIDGLTDYGDENGNELTTKEVYELEKKHDMDIAGLIENGKLGYLDHSYEIIETENTEDNDQANSFPCSKCGEVFTEESGAERGFTCENCLGDEE